jgi:NAD(P)-dependent dehydrogenase (short-subunit alcohol dehydrogenase family)
MKNKTWFITGISSGIGKALAMYVIQQGDFVVGTFRNEAQVKQFNTEYSGRGLAIQLELADEDSIRRAASELLSAQTLIDVFVNNAGVGLAGAIEETSMEESRALFEANFFGSLLLTQLLLPTFRKQKTGHIIQVSSHGGIKAFAGFGMYNASKFALEGMSEALAQELAPLNIKVSIVEPGPFRTGFAGASFLQAKNRIADYDTTAGSFRSRMEQVNGVQEGDPVKAAEVIYQLTTMEQPPLRQPLGKIALATIGAKLDSVRNDLESGTARALSAVFD